MGDNELRMQELLLKGSNILQSLLTCSICGNLLNDPRILTCCSQSACFICISQTFYQNQQEQSLFLKPQNKNDSTCPICNKELKKASLLPKNHFLENILQILELQNNYINNNNNNDYNDQNSVDCKNKRDNDNDNNKDKVIYCNSWDSREATTYCAECDSYLCSECWNIIHSICKYQTHTALSPHALKPTSRIADSSKLICYQHPNYFNDLYCQSCDYAICPLCLVDNHSDISKHKVTSVSKYADQIKSKLLQRCDLILTDSSKLNDEIQTRNSQITNYHLQIADLQNKIADLQSRLESENQKKSNLQQKFSEIKTIHQIITTAIDLTFNSESDFTNKQIANYCNADISMIYEKLYSFKLPSNNSSLPSSHPIALKDDSAEIIETKETWTLNSHSILGNTSSYKLISNLYFKKLSQGYCAITSKQYIKPNRHYEWQIKYLPISRNGWLFIGLHANHTAAFSFSYMEKECVGWNINQSEFANSNLFQHGKSSVVGKLSAVNNDILSLSFNSVTKVLQLQHPSWNVQTTVLHDYERLYLHFNSSDASFKLLSCTSRTL